MLFKYINIFLIVIICFGLTSCGTIWRGTTQQIMLTSTPPKADIYIDDYYCGQTPQAVLLTRKNSHQIMFTKEGYQAQGYVLDPHLSFILAGNVLYFPAGAALGATVGAIVIAGSSDMFIGIIPAVFGVIGAGVGVLAALIGTGVDVASGGAYVLSSDAVHAEFEGSN